MRAVHTWRHTVYKKSMASKYVIRQTLALPGRSKSDTLIQEGLRRLRNRDRWTQEEETRRVLGGLIYSTLISEYCDKTREYII